MSQLWDLQKLRLKSRNSLGLKLNGFSGGMTVEIPFWVFVGTKRRPRVLAAAGVHGDEYEGVAALQQVARELDPAELEGTVILLPVANPQAFYAGTRHNPVDLADLNRSFPGDAKGTMSDRLAHLLFSELVFESDFVLSMHCWSRTARAIPYVEYPDERSVVGRKSFLAACALGLDYAHPYTWHPGLMSAAAVRIGIPAVEPEVGGMGMITAEGEQAYRRIICRLLAHLKLIPSSTSSARRERRMPQIVDHSDVLASFAGLFQTPVRLGNEVKKDELLGTVSDLLGCVLEELRAPTAGIVGILRTHASVQPGDRLVQLFWEKKR